MDLSLIHVEARVSAGRRGRWADVWPVAAARLFVWAAVALFLLAVQPTAQAQNHLPAGSVGKITGDDISVEGGVFPTSVKGATSLFISSGSVLTVHSGTAELALAGGAVVDACGPAKFTVLESGGAFTLALNFGRVRVRAGNGAAIRIFTPFIVANPISISEIGTDFTIGLDVKDSVCVYAGEGAATLEQQFGGQNLVVPTTSEFMLAGERLNPVEAPVGSCRCTYIAPPPRVNGAGVTTATSNGPTGNAPGGTSMAGAASGNGTGGTSEGTSGSAPSSNATAAPAAGETVGGTSAGANAPPATAPIEASAAPAPENPAEAKVEPPVSNGGNATATKPAGQRAEENAQTATAQGPESTKPAAPGIAIDLGHAATPPPASQSATAQPAGSAPGSTAPANAPASGSAPGDNSTTSAGKLNQTPPSGVEMSSSGSPTPPQIKDPQFKAAPAPLSYQAPPPPIEVAQMGNVQAQSKQGFMVEGHVDGKSAAAAKPSEKANSTAAAPTATKPRKPYQAPGTGFWSKFKRLFSKPAPAPKPAEQP